MFGLGFLRTKTMIERDTSKAAVTRTKTQKVLRGAPIRVSFLSDKIA